MTWLKECGQFTRYVFKQLADPKYGLQLMSDQYILENLIEELRKK